MSYEAWGDDDDGLADVRENYRETLLQDGWLDTERASQLLTERDALKRTVADLAGTLQEVADYLEGQVDVIDGTEGDGPQPNRAMTLTQDIDAALERAGIRT